MKQRYSIAIEALSLKDYEIDAHNADDAMKLVMDACFESNLAAVVTKKDISYRCVKRLCFKDCVNPQNGVECKYTIRRVFNYGKEKENTRGACSQRADEESYEGFECQGYG